MKAAKTLLARLWPLVPISGLVGLVVFILNLRLPVPAPAPPAPQGRPSVRIVDAGVISGTRLRDPTPLFLPTEFNCSRRDYAAPPPGSSFAGYGNRMVFSESALSLDLPPAAKVPETAADALTGEPPGVPYLAFGRRDISIQAIYQRTAYIEVIAAGTGRSVLARPLLDARPPESAAWKPMEFMAAVDPSGLVGPLVQIAHSGVGAIDAYFSRYLAETFRVGQRLEPGFYRIVVGP